MSGSTDGCGTMAAACERLFALMDRQPLIVTPPAQAVVKAVLDPDLAPTPPPPPGSLRFGFQGWFDRWVPIDD